MNMSVLIDEWMLLQIFSQYFTTVFAYSLPPLLQVTCTNKINQNRQSKLILVDYVASCFHY